MNDSILVIASKDHPLYEDLKKSKLVVVEIDTQEPFEYKGGQYSQWECIFDFTTFLGQNKSNFLKKLSVETKFPIISDLTCHWGDKLMQEFPLVKGAFSSLFQGAGKSIEVYSQDDSLKDKIDYVFKVISKETTYVSSAGICFNFPRILSMIINEAWFSLEDKLASEEDIDTAMKFGVNYPLGPFEWCKNIKAKYVLACLDKLHEVTKDERYKASTMLRLKV